MLARLDCSPKLEARLHLCCFPAGFDAENYRTFAYKEVALCLMEIVDEF